MSQNSELDLSMQEELLLQVLELRLLAWFCFILGWLMLRYLPQKDLLQVSLGQVWGLPLLRLSKLECWLQMDSLQAF